MQSTGCGNIPAAHAEGGSSEHAWRDCAHIGVDAASGLVHSFAGTAANVNGVTQAGRLLHGGEEIAFGDAGYRGVHKRPEADGPEWDVAIRAGQRRKLKPFIEPDFVAEQAEKVKASIHAKVEHPFRVLKRQFGYTKVRNGALSTLKHERNTAQPLHGHAAGRWRGQCPGLRNVPSGAKTDRG